MPYYVAICFIMIYLSWLNIIVLSYEMKETIAIQNPNTTVVEENNNPMEEK